MFLIPLAIEPDGILYTVFKTEISIQFKNNVFISHNWAKMLRLNVFDT